MAANMRGLTQFITDIRGARVRELEEKRINKEMANIRKKFKGLPRLVPFDAHSCVSLVCLYHSDGNLDGYQKKKCVTIWRMFPMLGADTDWRVDYSPQIRGQDYIHLHPRVQS
jgi:hypothetical protein